MTYDYAITFACYNSVHYTKTLVNSLLRVGTPLERVVVVDNGSTDATRDYLLTLNLGGRIYNKSNQACGVAWNQGILHLQAEWSVVMNNDVIVPPQWIEKMIQTAIDHNLKVISPALMEGELDYDFDAFSALRRRGTISHRMGRPTCLAGCRRRTTVRHRQLRRRAAPSCEVPSCGHACGRPESRSWGTSN